MIISILKFNSRHPDSAWQQLVIALQFNEDLFDRFSVKKRQFLGGQRPPHNLWLSRGQLICLEKAFGRTRDPGVTSGYQKVILVGNIRKVPAIVGAFNSTRHNRGKLFIFTSPIGHLGPLKKSIYISINKRFLMQTSITFW